MLSSRQDTALLPSSTTRSSHVESDLTDKFEDNTDWNNNEKLNNLRPPTKSLRYRTYDLEGIETEGYGYTVRISADTSMTSDDGFSRANKRPTKGTRPKDSQAEDEFQPARRYGGWYPSWLFHNIAKRFRSAPAHPSNHNSLTIEIVTRQSLEVRESFHELDENNLDRGSNSFNRDSGSIPPDLYDGEDLTFLSGDTAVFNNEKLQGPDIAGPI
jgi:hypothetical protein